MGVLSIRLAEEETKVEVENGGGHNRGGEGKGGRGGSRGSGSRGRGREREAMNDGGSAGPVSDRINKGGPEGGQEGDRGEASDRQMDCSFR